MDWFGQFKVPNIHVTGLMPSSLAGEPSEVTFTVAAGQQIRVLQASWSIGAIAVRCEVHSAHHGQVRSGGFLPPSVIVSAGMWKWQRTCSPHSVPHELTSSQCGLEPRRS